MHIYSHHFVATSSQYPCKYQWLVPLTHDHLLLDIDAKIECYSSTPLGHIEAFPFTTPSHVQPSISSCGFWSTLFGIQLACYARFDWCKSSLWNRKKLRYLSSTHNLSKCMEKTLIMSRWRDVLATACLLFYILRDVLVEINKLI